MYGGGTQRKAYIISENSGKFYLASGKYYQKNNSEENIGIINMPSGLSTSRSKYITKINVTGNYCRSQIKK